MPAFNCSAFKCVRLLLPTVLDGTLEAEMFCSILPTCIVILKILLVDHLCSRLPDFIKYVLHMFILHVLYCFTIKFGIIGVDFVVKSFSYTII